MNIWKAGFWLGRMLTLPLLVSTLQAAPTSTQVYFQIDGRIEHADNAVHIPYNAQQVIFDIGDPSDTASATGSRVRYRLEGIDSNWCEKTDEMSLTIFFYNSIGDEVGQQIYIVNGKSSGWKGSVAESVFTHRQETLLVPPGAKHLSIVISSAGPLITVGTYIVTDILVAQEGDEKGSVKTILDSRPFFNDANHPPAGWIRTGRKPSMASIVSATQSSSRAFSILDDDPASYAEWTSLWQNSPTVTPGRRLTLDWNEIFETGILKWNRLYYPLPPPGHYRFVVQELDLLGHPLPIENKIDITILPPYWKDPWFWGKCVFGAAILIFLGSLYRRHFQRQLQLQRVRLVEQERMRIARDLHDDLGARLTHISLMSSFAGSNPSPANSEAKFSEISAMARELVESLSEVVWTVNPEKDRLESMVDYLCQLIQKLCLPTSLACHIDELKGIADYPVSSQVRHHVVLTVKEAVNNAIKHSGGTELHCSVRFQAPLLSVSISDNGKGLPPDPCPQGNGIKNMRERIALINGRIEIRSSAEKGTSVHFEVPIS